MIEARFFVGKLLLTGRVLTAFRRTKETPMSFIRRHVVGDWGDLDQTTETENNRSVNQGRRILSAYHLDDGTKIWVITEADRSSTRILLPEEY